MSRLETAAIPVTVPLIRNQPHLLNTTGQRTLAAFLCLITYRVAFTNPEAMAIPQADRAYLKETLEPPDTWKIWIAQYRGNRADEHWCRHHGMQILSSPNERGGPYQCNTQVTTFVFGEVCANVFSSTVWPEFRGYRGVRLSRIWPPTNFMIDWRFAPVITDDEIIGLAESIALPPL